MKHLLSSMVELDPVHRISFVFIAFLLPYSIQAFHPVSKLGIVHPIGLVHKYFQRENRKIYLKNENDYFELEDDDYIGARKSRPRFVNTFNDPVEDEFRRMRYQEEPDEYEDYTPRFSSKNKRNTKRGDDTFYMDDEDDDSDEDEESLLFERGGGNFWSNPKGGFDDVPKNTRMMKDLIHPPSSQRNDSNPKRKTRYVGKLFISL
jgi:hypothetical protein